MFLSLSLSFLYRLLLKAAAIYSLIFSSNMSFSSNPLIAVAGSFSRCITISVTKQNKKMRPSVGLVKNRVDRKQGRAPKHPNS